MSSIDNDIITAINVICNYLNENKIDYVIVGGISVIAWGRTRTTEDIDFIIDHRQLNVKDFTSYLRENDFLVDEFDFDGFNSKDHCTIFFKKNLFRIDIIGVYTQDNQVSIQESKKFNFMGIEIRIDSAESLIAHKLKFGSQQDYEDAMAIYSRIGMNLDKEKLKDHAKRIGISKKLVEFFEFADKE